MNSKFIVAIAVLLCTSGCRISKEITQELSQDIAQAKTIYFRVSIKQRKYTDTKDYIGHFERAIKTCIEKRQLQIVEVPSNADLRLIVDVFSKPVSSWYIDQGPGPRSTTLEDTGWYLDGSVYLRSKRSFFRQYFKIEYSPPLVVSLFELLPWNSFKKAFEESGYSEIILLLLGDVEEVNGS